MVGKELFKHYEWKDKEKVEENTEKPVGLSLRTAIVEKPIFCLPHLLYATILWIECVTFRIALEFS
jgi:hypothetical protein